MDLCTSVLLEVRHDEAVHPVIIPNLAACPVGLEKVNCPSSVYMVGVLAVMLKGPVVWWILLLGASWGHLDASWCLLGATTRYLSDLSEVLSTRISKLSNLSQDLK